MHQRRDVRTERHNGNYFEEPCQPQLYGSLMLVSVPHFLQQTDPRNACENKTNHNNNKKKIKQFDKTLLQH